MQRVTIAGGAREGRGGARQMRGNEETQRDEDAREAQSCGTQPAASGTSLLILSTCQPLLSSAFGLWARSLQPHISLPSPPLLPLGPCNDLRHSPFSHTSPHLATPHLPLPTCSGLCHDLGHGPFSHTSPHPSYLQTCPSPHIQACATTWDMAPSATPLRRTFCHG